MDGIKGLSKRPLGGNPASAPSLFTGDQPALSFHPVFTGHYAVPDFVKVSEYTAWTNKPDSMARLAAWYKAGHYYGISEQREAQVTVREYEPARFYLPGAA